MTRPSGLPAVFAAIAIQLTLGIAYIWSVFQTGVAKSIFGGDNISAGYTFSFLLATLTIGSVIGGKLAVKYSTRPVVFIGGLILSGGFLLASRVTPEFPKLLWLSYGLMGGVGMGFTYSTTIACAQKWYPHKKGLVTGVIVSALGFGGVVFTPIVEKLIKHFGGQCVGEPKTFMVLAGIFLVVCTAGCFFLKNPPVAAPATPGSAAAAKPANELTPTQMLCTARFYLLTAAFMLACMGGLMVIGFAKPIAVQRNFLDTAYYGVLAISLFNSFGRLFWGIVSDKLGRVNTILVLLAGGAILPLFFIHIPENQWVLYGLIALIGLFYGGLLSTFPSLTADLFGPKNMATNYGFVLLGFGAGAIASSKIAGYYKNLAEASANIDLMSRAFIIASCCAAAGIAMMVALKFMTRKKEAANG